jgi:integrase/recombinase XerD
MKPTDFSVHVTSFLTHYLAAQRNVSPNTIKAYRDVFTLLLRFCRDVQGIAPERLRLEQIDVSRVEAFLDYLERERKSSPQTRNHRLAALHAFFRYVQAEEPARMHQCQKILAIPSGDTLVPPSHIFRKKSWVRSWRSQTSEHPMAEEMQFC